MKHLFSVFGFLLILLVACCLILNTQTTFAAIQDGLLLCANAILPNLFPFFVLSDFWIRSGNAEAIARITEPVIRHLFHISGTASSAFLLGIVGGYPIGAKTIAHQYIEGQISKHDAERALLFCNNAGPAFIIGIVGITVFHSTAIGIALYIIHLLTAITIGILLRPKKHTRECCINQKTDTKKPLIPLIIESVSQGSHTAIQVCMFVLFFSVVSNMVELILPTHLPPAFSTILLGLLELTNGTRLLSVSAIQLRAKFAISAFLLGFGGISVIFQSLSLLYPSGLSAKKLLFGKLLQGIFSALIAYFSWKPLFDSVNCMYQTFGVQTVPSKQLILSLGMILTLITIVKITSGKKPNHPI